MKISLQITYQEKGTQTEPDTTEKILKAINTLSTKVDSMGKELQNLKANSQQHDYKYAELRQHVELRRSEDAKIPELQGDDGKLRKTHNNVCLDTAAGTSKRINTNLNQLFAKPFTQKPQMQIPAEPQTSTYAISLQNDKKRYNYITQSYIENIHKIQTYLNLNPRSTQTKTPEEDYITQKLQGYNKLIAQPKTNPNLVKTCYNYGLLNTVYTYTGEEIAGIPELHRAFLTYKRITKGNLFYIKCYTAPAEILYEEIKSPIQVVKIGLTRDMIIPEEIEKQNEIPKVEIPNFYANKRIIGIATIIQELANNYLNGNAIWSYYARDQVMIYANSKELRKSDMDEVQRWILSLLKPEEQPSTRALKKGFISEELLVRYCKLISNKYPDHKCSKCNGEDNVIPTVDLGYLQLI
ncbi:uncharacterized protein LOC107003543 [Solanum pennellii]|uniref:Uncharacterized protein LOC107003542 n=1 Tax=Solanum pennellii TaxID=28526 RepID=A0ABM1FIM2_SOLPN|nr:uncharacterized protein LOC107003542 [Solanum pennellii]XP_015057366.1 uncharacterized protein LOC107003543 [Solanum pennellii]